MNILLIMLFLLAHPSEQQAGVNWRDLSERDKALFNVGAVYMLKAQMNPRYKNVIIATQAVDLAWELYREDTGNIPRLKPHTKENAP